MVEGIEEVGIDLQGKIYVRPARTSFTHIYRAAMEVHWEGSRRQLQSPVPRAWTHEQWFSQILAAAADEYGIQLKLTPDTIWWNVPDELRAHLQATST